jgi:CheY-like chemotaxis protein
VRTRKLTLLLVEDDEVDVMNVRRALRSNRLGHVLRVAHDGVEALELLRSARDRKVEVLPQLILLDLNLPRMNGFEFLRELRADPELKRLVVIVLTTSDDERDVRAAYALNVAGYMVKPVAFGTFVDVVNALDRYWSCSELP